MDLNAIKWNEQEPAHANIGARTMDKTATKKDILQEACKLMTGLSKNDLNMIYQLLKRLSANQKKKTRYEQSIYEAEHGMVTRYDSVDDLFKDAGIDV